jgi:hypothetical protein
LAVESSSVKGAGLFLTWASDPDPTVAGYTLHYGSASHDYTVAIDAGFNLSTTVEELGAGNTYFFAVSAYNGAGVQSSNSQELNVTIPIFPEIIFQPSPQIAQAGAEVSLLVDVIATPPVTFQWYNGAAPVPGATDSLLTLLEISNQDAGVYTVAVTDPAGTAISQPATITVIDPLPGGAQVPGDPGQQLKASGTTLSKKLIAVLAAPEVPPSLASAAGIYNGLFYRTNFQGLPAIDEGTAGLLSDCQIDSQGNFNGIIYNMGFFYTVSGAFDESGFASTTVGRSTNGLPDLSLALQVTLAGGALLLSGVISNMDDADPWTAVLNAEPMTTAFSQLPNFVLSIPPLNGWPGGMVTGAAADGVIFLLGAMGDGSTFEQIAPVSANGAMPLFVEMNEDSELLAGWVNVFGNPSNPWLTWTSPGGAAGGGFTNIFQATLTPLGGVPQQ